MRGRFDGAVPASSTNAVTRLTFASIVARSIIASPAWLAATALIATLGACARLPTDAATPATQAVTANAAETTDWERVLPRSDDLRQLGATAQRANKPILVFFNLTQCPFCRTALQQALVPMFRDTAWRADLEFVQVTIDDQRSFIDFNGQRVDSMSFARARRGSFAPTILLVDGRGEALTEPLIGVANADYYSGYVEDVARRAMAVVRARGEVRR